MTFMWLVLGMIVLFILWHVNRVQHKKRQREREELRHLLGVKPWWGQQ